MRWIGWTVLAAVGCGSDIGLVEKEEIASTTEDETEPDSEPGDDDDDDDTSGPVAGEPIADAGADAEYSPLETVQLDATGSYDPDGLEIIAVNWVMVASPSGSTATLDDALKVKPEFFADLAGDYVFELTVQNSDGVWDSTADSVTITTTPLDGFYVELSWDGGNDLDLHLLQTGEVIYSDGDCNHCSKNPNWFADNNANPSLDADAIYGFGPETITIDEPKNGSYTVKVLYYGENGNRSCVGPCESSEATINIYLGGILAESYSTVLDEDGLVWTVADIQWPDGQIDFRNSLSSTNKRTCD